MSSSDVSAYSLKYTFHCPPRIVLGALTEQRDIARYTRDGGAVSEAKVGGKLRLYDGNIEGTYTELSEARIVLQWRLRDWKEGAFSQVAIDIAPLGDDSSSVALSHTGIPREDKFGNAGQEVAAQTGWRERIFKGIKNGLGLGVDEA